MGENEYKISLGVKLDIDNIQEQINEAGRNVKPIEIKVNTEAKELTKSIQDALGALSKGTKNALTLNTDSLEASLKDVSTSIKDIRTSLGTLDSKSGMKSLLASINQISSALEKASSQFESLNANLNALSGKDLSLNFGINIGGANPIGRNAAYGNKVRNETLPQLKQQMNDLVKYYNSTYKESLNEFEALQKMVSGTKLNTGDFFESFLFGKDSVATRMSGGSLASQMQAYKQYIDMFKQAANLKGLDISSVTSQFSKSADDLIQDAQDIQTGAKEMEDGFEKLKQVFGGGNNFNVEGISKQLDTIVVDLGEIRNALQSLSSGVSVDGLTQSFDRLSETIEKLVNNCVNMKSIVGDSVGELGGSVGGANSGLANAESNLNQITVASKNTSNAIKQMQGAMSSMRFDRSSIDAVTKDLEALGIEITKISLKDNGANLNVTVQGIDSVGRAVTEVRQLDKATREISPISKSFSQSFETSAEAIARVKKQNAATIREISREMNELIGLQQRIGNKKVEIRMMELQGGDKNQIADLNNQLINLEATYERLMHTFMQKLSANADILPNDSVEKFDEKINAVMQKTESRLKALDSAALKEINNEMTKFVKLLGQIAGLKKEVDKLKVVGGNQGQITELNRQLEELEATYGRLMHKFMEKLSARSDMLTMGDIKEFENELDAVFKHAENGVNRFQAKLNDTKFDNITKKLKSGSDGNTDFDTEISGVNKSFYRLSNQSGELRGKLDALEQSFKDIKAANEAVEAADSSEELIAAKQRLIELNEEYERSLKDIQNQLKINKDAEDAQKAAKTRADKADNLELGKKDAHLRLDKYEKGSEAVKKFGAEIDRLRNKINECADDADLKKVNKEIDILGKNINNTNVKTDTFASRFKKQWQQYSSYFSVATLFMYAQQGLRSMFEQVKLIDSAMTELKKVTDETDASYNKFLKNAAAKSKELGTTIDGLVSSTADFARLGYGFEDAQGLAEVANIYAVVGDEIDGVEGATESLISTMAAFKDEMGGMSNSDFAMSIIDVYNEIGKLIA